MSSVWDRLYVEKTKNFRKRSPYLIQQRGGAAETQTRACAEVEWTQCAHWKVQAQGRIQHIYGGSKSSRIVLTFASLMIAHSRPLWWGQTDPRQHQWLSVMSVVSKVLWTKKYPTRREVLERPETFSAACLPSLGNFLNKIKIQKPKTACSTF